jgi:hypothetical protein
MRNDSEHKRDTEHSRHRSHTRERKRAAKRDLKHDDHHDDHHEGLEPKLSIEELEKHRTSIFTGSDGRDYHSELPGSWSNAKVAAEATEKVCQECRDSPHFDTEGYSTNRELGRRIQEAFSELKVGKGFVLAWRLYADKDHPRWQVADGCGCGCSGGTAEEPKPTPKAAKRKPGRKAKKPSGR